MAEVDVAEVEFVFQLTGAGWSEARLTIRAASTPLSASYLDDALGDLVRATAALTQAQSTVRVSWAEEPGEFRWVLDRSGDELSVRVLWFDSLWGPDPDEKGKVLLKATCSLTAFQGAIASGARAPYWMSGERPATARSGSNTTFRHPHFESWKTLSDVALGVRSRTWHDSARLRRVPVRTSIIASTSAGPIRVWSAGGNASSAQPGARPPRPRRRRSVHVQSRRR